MENKLKQKMIQGESVVGTFFQVGGTTAVECLGISGMDFLIIDTEHGPFDVESSMNFILSAELKGITPLVRVEDSSRSSILKMLDIGAKGVVVPNIETVDEVKKIVEYGKNYPIGKRGFEHTRVADYGFADFANDINEYFRISNENTLILPQCETQGCLDNIEEIVNIDGVDGIFIGPYDLSIGMGIPGQFTEPDFANAIYRILKACKDAEKFAFIYSPDSKTAKKYLADGFNGVAITTDITVYINGFRSIVNEVRDI